MMGPAPIPTADIKTILDILALVSDPEAIRARLEELQAMNDAAQVRIDDAQRRTEAASAIEAEAKAVQQEALELKERVNRSVSDAQTDREKLRDREADLQAWHASALQAFNAEKDVFESAKALFTRDVNSHTAEMATLRNMLAAREAEIVRKEQDVEQKLAEAEGIRADLAARLEKLRAIAA